MTILIDAEDIRLATERLAAELADEITDDWILVALMDGAMIFASDLMRALWAHNINPAFESLCLSSYGHARQSLGSVRCLKDIEQDLSGKSVLLVDDVYESGLTFEYARQSMLGKGAAKVLTCAFARKPHDNPAGQPPDLIGWEAPDRFLVGYGLDDKGRHRGQPFISAVD